MSIIETAKDLLRKGIALNDEELIAMANSLLTDTPQKKTTKKAVAKKTAKAKSVKRASRNNKPTTNPDHIDEDFKVNNNSKIKGAKKKRVKGSGKNIFVDDRTLARSEEDQTPHYVPSPRDRPKHKKVTKKCRDCGNSFIAVFGDDKVGEYKCNKCITGE